WRGDAANVLREKGDQFFRRIRFLKRFATLSSKHLPHHIAEPSEQAVAARRPWCRRHFDRREHGLFISGNGDAAVGADTGEMWNRGTTTGAGRGGLRLTHRLLP